MKLKEYKGNLGVRLGEESVSTLSPEAKIMEIGEFLESLGEDDARKEIEIREQDAYYEFCFINTYPDGVFISIPYLIFDKPVKIKEFDKSLIRNYYLKIITPSVKIM